MPIHTKVIEDHWTPGELRRWTALRDELWKAAERGKKYLIGYHGKLKTPLTEAEAEVQAHDIIEAERGG